MAGLLAAALFVVYAALAALRWRVIGPGVDDAFFEHALWVLSHRRDGRMSYSGQHVLVDHASLLLYPLALLSRPFPAGPFLVAVQSGALALGAVPLYLIARRLAHLAPAPAVLAVVACSAHPALLNVGLIDFHTETLAIPALIGAVLFGAEERWRPFVLCAAVACTSKDQVPLVVAALGLVLLVRGSRRAGALTIAGSLGYMALAVGWMQPTLAGGRLVHATLFARYGHTPGEVLTTAVTRPGVVLGDLWIPESLGLLSALLGPVLLLPLLRAEWLLPAVPTFAINVLASRDAARTVDHQYAATLLPFVAVAAVMAIGLLSRRALGVPFAASAAWTCIALAVVWPSSAVSVSRVPSLWSAPSPFLEIRRAAADVVPDDASVAASDRMAPHVASRGDLYRFPEPFVPTFLTRLAGLPETVDYVVVDTADRVQWTGRDQDALRTIQDAGFRVVWEQRGILVLRR